MVIQTKAGMRGERAKWREMNFESDSLDTYCVTEVRNAKILVFSDSRKNLGFTVKTCSALANGGKKKRKKEKQKEKKKKILKVLLLRTYFSWLENTMGIWGLSMELGEKQIRWTKWYCFGSPSRLTYSLAKGILWPTWSLYWVWGKSPTSLPKLKPLLVIHPNICCGCISFQDIQDDREWAKSQIQRKLTVFYNTTYPIIYFF